MRKIEFQLLASYLIILFFVYLLITVTSCTNGWSLGNAQMSHSDSSLVEIVDQDSTKHYYLSVDLENDSWCLQHHRWEEIDKK